MMDPSQSPGVQERVIKIRAEFTDKMKAALDKVRQEYDRHYSTANQSTVRRYRDFFPAAASLDGRDFHDAHFEYHTA